MTFVECIEDGVLNVEVSATADNTNGTPLDNIEATIYGPITGDCPDVITTAAAFQDCNTGTDLDDGLEDDIIPVIDLTVPAAIPKAGEVYIVIVDSDGDGDITIAPQAGGALPLELLSFEAVCINNFKKRLTWVTDNEIDIRNFIIERAFIGTDDWIQLDTETPRGGVDRQTIYTYIDNYTIGDAYYRLRIIEADGSFSFSEVSVTDCEPATFNIPHIYPNPTSGELTMIYESLDRTPIKFELLDVLGRVLMTEVLLPSTGLNVKVIDFANLSAATYFIRLNDGKQQLVEKVTKF